MTLGNPFIATFLETHHKMIRIYVGEKPCGPATALKSGGKHLTAMERAVARNRIGVDSKENGGSGHAS